MSALKRLLPVVVAALLAILTGCPLLPQALQAPTPVPGEAMRLSDPSMIRAETGSQQVTGEGAPAAAGVGQDLGVAAPGPVAGIQGGPDGPWTFSGRVDWPGDRSAQAQASDLASKATVQLLDLTLNRTVKATMSDQNGRFSLDILALPRADHDYVLEAVKGLGNHAAGRDAVRLRLPMVFIDGEWKTPIKDLQGLTINMSTTALAIAIGHRTGTDRPVTVRDNLGTIRIGEPQDTPEPPTPDTYTPPATGGITVEEFHDIYGLASEAFNGDRDPVAAVLMDSVTLGFRAASEPHAVTEASPLEAQAGDTITVLGRNFDTKNVAGNQIRIGKALVSTRTAEKAKLTGVIPVDATPGYVSVQIGNLIAIGPYVKVKPTIETVSPEAGARTGEKVVIEGTGFPLKGTRVYLNGLELAATVAPDRLEATLPDAAVSGPLVVQTPDYRVDAGNFRILPKVTGLAPLKGVTGSNLVISGTGFHGYNAGASKVTVAGVAASVVSWANAQITVKVPDDAVTGTVTVATEFGSHTGPSFTVAPTLTALSPASATTDTEITLSGTGFLAKSTESRVSFNGSAVTDFVSWSNRAINVKLPAAARSGPVSVTTAASRSNSVDIIVLPTLAAISPASGKTGTTVTLTGTGFDPYSPATSKVFFDGLEAASIKSWTPEKIEAVVPANATSGKVTLKTSAPGNPAATGKQFDLRPDLTGISPSSARGGDKVTLTGTGFDPLNPAVCKVLVKGAGGDLEAKVLSWTPEKVEFTVPDGAITGDVVLKTAAAGQPVSAGLKLTILPTLKTLTPSSATTGTSVTLGGTGFGTLVAGTSKVEFAGVSAEIVSWRPTSVVAKVPATATSGDVVVGPAGVPASNAMPFKVLPNLTAVSPDPQITGQTVTLTGTGFDPFKSGTSKVTIAGLDATTITWDPTRIVVRVPDAATTGDVKVKTSASGSPESNAIKLRIKPAIASFDADPIRPGQVLKVSGTGFETFLSGTSKVAFSGATVTSGMSWANTSVSVTVPMDAITGAVAITNRTGLTSAGATLKVAPLLESLGVSYSATGATLTLKGAAFGSARGTGTVSFGGVAAATYPSWSNREIKVVVPDGAITGLVTVTNGEGETSNSLNLVVTPTVKSVSASSGVTGDLVTITGTGFHNYSSTGSKVYFGGTAATAFASGGWTNTQIKVYVPDDAQTGAILVRTAHGDSNTSFSFTVKPKLASLTSKAAIGDTITLSGSGFHGYSAATSKVTFAGETGAVTAVTYTSWDNRTIKVVVPAKTRAGSVTVTTAHGTSGALSFQVLPKISSLSITSGIAGDTVTITGTGFDAYSSTSSKVKFNGRDAGVASSAWGYSSITAKVPSGATSGSVTVENAAGTSNGVSFTVLYPPSISSLSSTRVTTGTSLTIYGSNLMSPRGGTTQVYFQGYGWVNTSSGTATYVRATVPTAAYTGPIYVKTLDGQASYSSLTILPQITSITGSANIGDRITITGSGFGPSRGSSYVSFPSSGTASSYGTWNQTTITVTVPSGTTSGNVYVQIPGVGSSYRYMAIKPYISSLSASSVRPGDRITIYGNGFDPYGSNTRVYFNGVAYNPSSTDWRYYDRGFVYATVPSGATSGNVTVYNSAGQTSNGRSLTVLRGPTITSISPTSTRYYYNTYLYLYGSNFGSSGGQVYITGSFRKYYLNRWYYGTQTVTLPLSTYHRSDTWIRGQKPGSYIYSYPYYYYFNSRQYYTVKMRDRYGNWSTGDRSLYVY